MTTPLFGDSAAYTLADAVTATATVPANGEPVSAPAAFAPTKVLLDYVASVAQNAYNQQVFGVGKIKSYGSVAAVKALTGMQEGDVAMLMDPNYVGGGSTLLSGFGLFVFYPGATWAQTLIPGVTDAWLVIQPNDNSGRWINVIAGIGWNIGGDPSFQPKVVARSQQWSAVGTVNNSVDYAGLVFTNVGTEIVLGTGLPQNAAIHLDFDFSVRSPTMGTSGLGAVVEVSVGGGAWAIVPGSKKPLGAGGGTGLNTEWMSVHLGAAYTAPNNNTYDFRVSLSGAAAQTMTLFRTWSARGTSYLAT